MFTLSRTRTGHGAKIALDGGCRPSCSQPTVTSAVCAAALAPTWCGSALGPFLVFSIVRAVIRGHGTSRHRSNVVSVWVLASWPGRLALLAIALGLVLMHHVVSAHQHASPSPPQSGLVTHSVAAPGAAPPPTAHHDHDLGPAPAAGFGSEQTMGHDTRAGVLVDSSAAVLHRHPDGSGHDHSWSLLHVCFVALLGAAILLLVLVLFASWWRLPPRATAQRGLTASAEPRAPPTSARLAELQLLRL